MDTVGLSEARGKLGDLVDRARHMQIRTAITRNGRVAAVLVSADWYEAHKGDEDTDVNERGSLQQIQGRE